MSKPVSIAEYKLRKRAEELRKGAVDDESPVTMEFMLEFREEMRNEFAKIHAQFDRMKSKWKRQDAGISLVTSSED